MFSHPTTIIFLTKGIAHITYVASNRIVKTVRQEWNTQTLPKLFATIKASSGSRAVRVLLADEFSYILELSIPVHVLNKRLHIEQQLKTHIPEILHSNEWDYKEITSKSKEKKALVFTPVKYVYDALLKASDVSGLRIEAIEPVQIAGKRHKNPVVGLAIKTDLKGKDEDVLNVVPSHWTATENITEDDEASKNSPSYKIWFILVATLLLIVGCAFVIYSQFTKSRTTTIPDEQPVPTEAVASPSADLSPTEQPTPTEEITINPSSYTVHVLNGAGIAGISNEIKALLEEKGFADITTGNADNYDYTKTLVQRKENVPAEIVPFISEILTDYDVEGSDLLTIDEPYDVLIIVGTRI